MYGWYMQHDTSAEIVYYKNALKTIERLLKEHHWRPFTSEEYHYTNILYPADALTILAFSRSIHWPTSLQPDFVLETLLLNWLRTISITNYTKDLFEAMQKLKCEDGMFLRLNFDTIAQPDMTSIKIYNTEIKTEQNKPKSTAFTGELRRNMRQFLIDYGRFTTNIDTLYTGLETIHYQYNLEQSLLSWMGYIIVKGLIKNNNMQFTKGQLLSITNQTSNI
jgi:hypothetical protein